MGSDIGWQFSAHIANNTYNPNVPLHCVSPFSITLLPWRARDSGSDGCRWVAVRHVIVCMRGCAIRGLQQPSTNYFHSILHIFLNYTGKLEYESQIKLDCSRCLRSWISRWTATTTSRSFYHTHSTWISHSTESLSQISFDSSSSSPTHPWILYATIKHDLIFMIFFRSNTPNSPWLRFTPTYLNPLNGCISSLVLHRISSLCAYEVWPCSIRSNWQFCHR